MCRSPRLVISQLSKQHSKEKEAGNNEIVPTDCTVKLTPRTSAGKLFSIRDGLIATPIAHVDESEKVS